MGSEGSEKGEAKGKTTFIFLKNIGGNLSSGAKNKYGTMSLIEICKIPIIDIAEKMLFCFCGATDLKINN